MRSSVDVHNHLQSLEIKHELVTLSGPIGNASRMAEILDLHPSLIVKTLLFIADGIPVMVMVPGDKKADAAKLRQHLGATKVAFATEVEARELTDYFVGALPPVGLKSRARTVIDPDITTKDVVYTAGGEPNVVLKIRVIDLFRVTDADVADIGA